MTLTIEDKQSFIKERIETFKGKYEEFRDKSDDFVFTALCVKSYFFRNPNINITGQQLLDIVVDGTNDGGCDALLVNNDEDASELIFCQSKYTKTTSNDEVKDAVHKLMDFSLMMQAGNYGNVNEKAKRQYVILNNNNDIGEESKNQFYFFTIAPQKSMKTEAIKKVFNDTFKNNSLYELHIEYLGDVYQAISEAESIRGSIEEDCITIEGDNCLTYNDQQAAIVNISAFSLNELFIKYGNNLLAQNLRYYFKSKSIDEQIKNTIINEPTSFWYRNNGITVICDDFNMTSATRIKLNNFSIINGGQTTTLIGKSKNIDRNHDFYLTCKIIKNPGSTDAEKSDFVLRIAQATNSQKPISPSDLKANLPEQISLSKSFMNLGIQYTIKKGEKPKAGYTEKYQNLNISKAGKLGLAGLFQLPASSRNKPSLMYKDRFYNPLFLNPDGRKALFLKDLLYIEYVFNSAFLPSLTAQYKDDPTKTDLIGFASNSRTICLAFSAFASRYLNGNFDKNFVATLMDRSLEVGSYDRFFYDTFSNLGNQLGVFNDDYSKMNLDHISDSLFSLFHELCVRGNVLFKAAKMNDAALTPTNFLKKDENYFMIITNSWDDLEPAINKCSDIFKR